MRTARICFTLLLFALLAGCRAHMVTIKLVNTSAGTLSTIIVDYPSATFGKDQLAPGETFSSPVKLTDTGPLKVQFTDAKGASHTVVGSVVHRNDEGLIEINLNQGGATITSNITGR